VIPFVVLSLLPTLGLWLPAAREWDQSGHWAAALAICVVPVMTFALILLISHLRRVTDAQRARAKPACCWPQRRWAHRWV